MESFPMMHILYQNWLLKKINQLVNYSISNNWLSKKFSIFLTISLIDSFTSKRNFANRFSIFSYYNVQENIIGAISSEVIIILIIITLQLLNQVNGGQIVHFSVSNSLIVASRCGQQLCIITNGIITYHFQNSTIL